MINISEALATAKGEIIYQDQSTTTIALTTDIIKTDPVVKENMLIWTNFIAKQFNPATVDEAVKKYIDKNYVWYGAEAPEGLTGEGLRDFGNENIDNIFNGLSDFHITNRMFGEGERVANFWHMTGIHTSTYKGIPASGKKVDFRGIAISLFKNGKQIEEWEYNDNFEEKLKSLHNLKGIDNEVKESTGKDYLHKYEALQKNIDNWDRTVSEKINTGDYQRINSAYSDNYIYYGAGDVCAKNAKSGMKAGIDNLRAGFSDIKITNDIFGEGDRAVNHFIIQGTHDGLWRGIKPTGRKICIKGIAIVRFSEGEIVEEWEYVDDLAVLNQLGLFSAESKEHPAEDVFEFLGLTKG